MLPLNKKPYRVFSLWLRIFHWTMVLCVTALFWTGLYIGDPGFQATPGSLEPTIAVGGWFSMEVIRQIHFIAAFILIAALIFRIYGGIRYRGDRLFPRFHKKVYYIGIWESIKHYLMLPQQREHRFLRNSLARTSYVLVYLMLIGEIFTGLAMYAQVTPNSWVALVFNPVNLMLSEYQTHMIHHYLAWGFLLFTVIHVYLAFREDVMEESGEVSSMVSGMKFYPEDPEDIEDLYGTKRK